MYWKDNYKKINMFGVIGYLSMRYTFLYLNSDTCGIFNINTTGLN